MTRSDTLFQYAREDIIAARFEQRLRASDARQWIARFVRDARFWHHRAIRARRQERAISGTA